MKQPEKTTLKENPDPGEETDKTKPKNPQIK